MRLTILTGYVCLDIFAPAFPCCGEEVERLTITVRLINSSRAGHNQVSKAAREVGWVFEKAALKVEWIHCRVNDAPSLPEGDPCGESAETFALGIIDRAPELLTGTGLGFALVSSGDRNHGAVLYPRVAELAKAHPMFGGVDQALALAIAHELGHLILGSTTHSSSGLLRSTCGAAELQAFAQRRLTFSPADAAAMRARVRFRIDALREQSRPVTRTRPASPGELFSEERGAALT